MNGWAVLMSRPFPCAQWVEELKAMEEEYGSALDVAIQASTMYDQTARDGFFTEVFAAKQRARGVALRQPSDGQVQYPTYHAAWRGPRGGKINHVATDNGKELKFYAHPKAAA